MSTFSYSSTDNIDLNYENSVRRREWAMAGIEEDGSRRTVDSEESYDSLFSTSEMLEQFIFLLFDQDWIFAASMANTILYLIFTYQVSFNEDYVTYGFVRATIFFCDFIILLDIIASILHLFWKHYAKLRNFAPRSKILILIDFLSTINMFAVAFSPLGKMVEVQLVEITLIVFRMYRIVLYIFVANNTSGSTTLSNLLKQHGLILLLMTHTFTCIIKSYACYKCPDSIPNWTTTISKNIFSNDESPLQWYLVSMWLILGGSTSLGIGTIHPVGNAEHLILVLVMILGFIVVDGIFVGTWTLVQMESYRKHFNFRSRLELIEKSLNHNRVPKSLKNKISKYYRLFWKQNKGVRYSKFFYELPTTFKEQVNLDMYWNVFEQNLHPAFKRAIASVMTTEIYTGGEYIYNEKVNKDIMVFLFKGSMQILSSEDGESPILTLGIGTCLGEINLFFTVPSLVNVKAVTYCIIQCLKKEDFWRVAFRYRKLNQLNVIRELVDKKIDGAKESYELKKMMTKFRSEGSTLPLKMVKCLLRPEQIIQSNVILRKTEINALQDDEYEPTKLYVLSLHHTAEKNSDEIFMRTNFPWLLQPDSQLLKVWEYMVCGIVFFVFILYPYLFSFIRVFSNSMILVVVIINGTYFLDLIIQIFTAVELERSIITKMKDLLLYRFRQLDFLCEVLACFPFAVLFKVLKLTDNSRIMSLYGLHRLLKIFRLINFVNKVTTSFDVNIALIKCFKYFAMFMMSAYIIGCILYMISCFTDTCYPVSWFSQLKEEDLQIGGSRYENPFFLSLYYGALIISQTSFASITPRNIMEICFATFSALAGIFLFCYLVSDFSATIMLQERAKLTFIEVVTVIQKYLKLNNMLKINQVRTNEYLNLQWNLNLGYNVRRNQSIYFDIPAHFFKEQEGAKHFLPLSKIPLFQGLNEDLIKKICTNCKEIFLPPNEIVMHAGETVRDLYFIDKGYCEVISAASGKIEKVIGPLSHFCDFDMILEQPGIYNIRTVTHARLFKVAFIHIRRVLAIANLEEPLIALAKISKNSVAVQRIFMRSGTVNYYYIKPNEKLSWFKFPRGKLHPLSIDYEEGFGKKNSMAFLKAILLRRTILPDGKFFINWEIFQTIRILIVSTYYTSLPFHGAYSITTQYLWMFFTVISCIDIYLRMHVCYYNKQGILVTHPRYTALNYLTTTFPLDFLSLFPFTFLVNLLSRTKKVQGVTTISSLESILRLSKLFQLYRVNGLFNYFDNNLKPRRLSRTVVKFFLISLVFLNACACILIFITCDLSIGNQGYFLISPKKGSWLEVVQKAVNYDVKEPICAYITAVYYITVVSLSSGTMHFKAQQVSEFIFLLLVIVSGYLFFTYIVIIMITHKASIDMNLTLYQEHMRHLIAYMKKENIKKSLTKKVIKHFEFIWQKCHGMASSNILRNCHLALHEDSVLYLYEETLMRVLVFEDMGKSFYRLLGLHLEEMYFLPNATIIHLNDIISTIYIIHEGEVQVLGPDGSIFATLTRGCMFGNIDEVAHSRSRIAVLTLTNVDLLCIQTDVFYKLVSDYPVLLRKLKSNVLLENSSYVNVKNKKEDLFVIKTKKDKSDSKIVEYFKKLSIYIDQIKMLNMLSFFLSSTLASYHLAFQFHFSWIFVVSYALDAYHLIILFTGFQVPYYNSLGERITDRTKIRNRYLTPMRFYRKLFALLPFEVIAFLLPNEIFYYAFTWLRINRLLKLGNVFQYFNVTYDRLNINVVGIKVGIIVVFFCLMLHFGACMIYMVACPRGKCLKDSWIGHNQQILNNNHYLNSIYLTTCILCHNGFNHMSPRTLPEILLSIFMLLVAKYAVSILMGEIAAIAQYYSCTMLQYDYQKKTLKDYMQNSYVAEPLVKRVVDYASQLWGAERGTQLPVLLQRTPSYLLEEMMREAYGEHIFTNSLFNSCHKDFLRQLIAKLNVETFFKGDILCQEGDINNTMYFIHKGNVNVHMVIDNEEIIKNSLKAPDCFGLVQGLFAFTPHTYTYKSASFCVILSLNLMDWVHLLKYYKAARSEIYTKLRNMPTYK